MDFLTNDCDFIKVNCKIKRIRTNERLSLKLFFFICLNLIYYFYIIKFKNL